jgi:hypothetical protein
MSIYFSSFSIIIYFLLFSLAIFQVVQLQANISSITSHSLLQDSIWSSASFSGNIAGCHKSFFHHTGYFHTLVFILYSLVVVISSLGLSAEFIENAHLLFLFFLVQAVKHFSSK